MGGDADIGPGWGGPRDYALQSRVGAILVTTHAVKTRRDCSTVDLFSAAVRLPSR